MVSLPYVTTDLPGAGGMARMVPEDFQVEEIPAYLPSGSGSHLYLLVEKRGRNTREVQREIARRLSVREGDTGVAGQKDRQALTLQWMSFAGADPKRAAGLEGEGWRVLDARLHGNKLRTGHLRGNRFRLRLRGVHPQGLERARAIAAALATRGLPNFYGPQRFGRLGDNAEVGRLLLLHGAGQRSDDPRVVRALRDRTQRRFLVSAFQSEVFNRVLAARLQDGSWVAPQVGDVLQKLPAGGMFVCDDPAVDAERVESFEVSITGPMPGRRVRLEPTGAPAELEARILAATGIGARELAASPDAEGTRRPLRIPVEVEVEPVEDDLLLSFALPPGAYATSVLREITRRDDAPEESA